MELEVWKGDWGLPSVEPNCLAVMAYCKFGSVPVDVKATNNPWKSPTGNLPVLRHDDHSKARVSSILSYLREQKWGTDFDLSVKQSGDMLAYLTMIEEKLVPAVLHLWWADNKTYIDLTRPWFAKAVPFPLNFYYPGKKQSEYLQRVYHSSNQNLSEEEIEAKIYKDGKECINVLSTKLGKSEFFFGNMPSSLDAVVFGYIAPLLKAPLPNNALVNHLKACDNLASLCSTILLRYFPTEVQESDQKKRDAEEKTHEEAVEYPNKKRNMLVSGMVAMSAMVGYAFMSGLVQVEIADADDANETKDMHREPQKINLTSTESTGMFEDNQRAQDENGNTA
ncbi:metaxin-1-like [Lineus longissimus]|uniref:metaxin-1-like n=1 Tax=Lineus longissimus TaxID=88925 RepID=UPI002B4F730C